MSFMLLTKADYLSRSNKEQFFTGPRKQLIQLRPEPVILVYEDQRTYRSKLYVEILAYPV